MVRSAPSVDEHEMHNFPNCTIPVLHRRIILFMALLLSQISIAQCRLNLFRVEQTSTNTATSHHAVQYNNGNATLKDDEELVDNLSAEREALLARTLQVEKSIPGSIPGIIPEYLSDMIGENGKAGKLGKSMSGKSSKAGKSGKAGYSMGGMAGKSRKSGMSMGRKATTSVKGDIDRGQVRKVNMGKHSMFMGRKRGKRSRRTDI